MTPLRVMTWNVENLFRPMPGSAQDEQRRYERKLALLATVITQADPDVVALQEVGGEEPLFDLQEALGAAYLHRASSAFPDSRGIRVAFLSKLAIHDRIDIVDFPPGPALAIQDFAPAGGTMPVIRLGRGALRIRVEVGGASVQIVTTHLKSKLLTFRRPGGSSFTPRDETERAQVASIALLRRAAEAATLRIHINGLLTNNDRTPLILLGDVNDVPEAQTSLLLTGPSGSEIGTLAFHRADKGDDARLFNVAPLIAAERRFSRVHQGRAELLDQIFASEELFPLEAPNQRRLPTTDSLVDFQGQLPSIGDDPNERTKAIGPDHAPVIATFELA